MSSETAHSLSQRRQFTNDKDRKQTLPGYLLKSASFQPSATLSSPTSKHPSEMSQSTPTVQSRHSRSEQAEARREAAIIWLENEDRSVRNCLVQDVTDVVNFNTAVGKTLLSKYDPAKLVTIYHDMYTSDRIHLVEDFRKDVIRREKRDREWRRVHVMATQKYMEGGGDVEAWKKLSHATREALENTAILRDRLIWCETRFEAGKLTGDEIAEALAEGEKEAALKNESDEEEKRGRSPTRT